MVMAYYFRKKCLSKSLTKILFPNLYFEGASFFYEKSSISLSKLLTKLLLQKLNGMPSFSCEASLISVSKLLTQKLHWNDLFLLWEKPHKCIKSFITIVLLSFVIKKPTFLTKLKKLHKISISKSIHSSTNVF